MRKISIAVLTSLFLLASAGASADSYSQVVRCTLNDGKTKEDAQALNAKWLTWARKIAGTEEISSSYATTVVGDTEGFVWIDNFPSLVAWAKVAEAELKDDDPELSAAFEALADCSSNRLWRIEPTASAR